MSKFYTYDAWYKTFRPITNKMGKYSSETQIIFETYDEEYEFVKAQDPNKVWTEVDGDSGTYIISGLHFVNRIGYYVTREPWTDEYTEIPTWVYRTCDCTEDESFEDGYNPDCTECEEGTIDIPCDTVVDLIEIYGEADIVH